MKIAITVKGVDYTIDVEPSCFIPRKIGVTKLGEDKSETLGYPSTLSRAINMIIKEELAGSDDVVTIMEYVRRYEEMLKEIKEHVDFEV